jgi:hypothetical protein
MPPKSLWVGGAIFSIVAVLFFTNSASQVCFYIEESTDSREKAGGHRNELEVPEGRLFQGTLVFSVLLDEFVNQVHGLQSIRCERLETSLGVSQGGQIPFRFSSAVDVARIVRMLSSAESSFEAAMTA